MRLAICLFRYFPYGGLERDFLLIAQECLLRHHQIDIYTTAWEGTSPKNFNITMIDVKGKTNHQQCYEFSQKLQSYLSTITYDLVLGFNKISGLDAYYAGDFCFEAKAQQERSWYYRLTPRYKHLAELEQAVFASNSHTNILLLSEIDKATYQHYYQTATDRFHLLPPGIAKCEFSAVDKANIRQAVRFRYAVKDNEFLILLVGTYFKTKGLDRAIRAIASLPKAQRLLTKLIVVGLDKSGPYKRLARRLSISENIHFVGAQADVMQFMLASDLLIHPAYRETAGKVLLEALTTGLPVLTTSNCGFATHIDNAQAGFISATPFNQTEFNAQLTAMLNKDTLAIWSRNANNYIETTDLYSLVPTTVTLLEKLADNKKIA